MFTSWCSVLYCCTALTISLSEGFYLCTSLSWRCGLWCRSFFLVQQPLSGWGREARLTVASAPAVSSSWKTCALMIPSSIMESSWKTRESCYTCTSQQTFMLSCQLWLIMMKNRMLKCLGLEDFWPRFWCWRRKKKLHQLLIFSLLGIQWLRNPSYPENKAFKA